LIAETIATLAYNLTSIAITMIIVWVEDSESNSMVVELPYANMKVDPRRVILGIFDEWHEFSFSVIGRILTITRIDEDEDDGFHGFRMRVYTPTEDIPDFTSTVYTLSWRCS